MCDNNDDVAQVVVPFFIYGEHDMAFVIGSAICRTDVVAIAAPSICRDDDVARPPFYAID